MTSQQHIKPEQANNLMVFILILHLFLAVAASAVPEGHFLFWLPLYAAAAVLVFLRLLFLWKRYSKQEPKRYNSLQLYWMLTGLSFFAVMPLIRLAHGTAAFWIVLAGTVLLFLCSHLWRERIAAVFVNPKKKRQLATIPKALAIIVIAGIIIMAVLRFTPAHPNDGLSVFSYLIGAFMTFLAPPFSLTEERIEELRGSKA